ncbi:uncharacterized protein LOC135072901 [Ostrinia nubilalis]|uniref:uncharacterized protein LOC135072901 n=1 Tax=Ostrinia nubilalis TaxID=29057 RepID=UPI0030822936
MVFRGLKFSLCFIAAVSIKFCVQYCPEEVSSSGIKVTWHQSPQASNVESDPLCFYNDTLVTRNCINNTWVPSLTEVQPCYKAVKYFDPSTCPPGFNKISETYNKYCYKIGKPSPWNYPCFKSGGATVINELSLNKTETLLSFLNATKYRHFWLPAQRQNVFAPIKWSIPGPNWGRVITATDTFPLKPSLFKNCLLLDVEERTLITDTCTKEYPSLCFYINDFHCPAKCPDNYHAFRYMLDDGKCYGIKNSLTDLSFSDFLNGTCEKPMGSGQHNELRRFIYSKIAEVSNHSKNTWCWFGDPNSEIIEVKNRILENSNRINTVETDNSPLNLVRVINNMGTVGLMDSFSRLPCMACEANMIYGETELVFEYSQEENSIYLTIYFPSGLWRYDDNDIGVQCFSDAKGFSGVIDVNNLPTQVEAMKLFRSSQITTNIEKVMYVIDLVTDRSARYWCEGHTKNFSLITTEKIVVNPQGNQVHVFSLVLNTFVHMSESNNNLFNLIDLRKNISSIFQAEKALVMDILDYNMERIQILMHLHVKINDTGRSQAANLQETFNFLLKRAFAEFPHHNFTFINMSSSVFCLPTTSLDPVLLDWDLTPIGHMATPQQFCLQSNGLPVNRACRGSYLLGSFWGQINGQCDYSYKPSSITTFLFNFISGRIENNYYTSKFLTDGLNYVLKDVEIIIPADIYYLSLCFQYVLQVTHKNETSIETGDIENIAWVMDRMMNIDNSSLHLAQIMNSTNVILDSVNNIIEVITITNKTSDGVKLKENIYQLAIQPRFIIQISYPHLNNVTGIAVINSKNSNNFTDMYIQPLYKNTTMNDVLIMENLEVATWLPSDVIDNLNKTNIVNSTSADDIHVIISIYNNNAIFQELNKNQHVITSRIIEVTVPGYLTNLQNPIPLIFKELRPNIFGRACGFWDFHSDKAIYSSWSKRGCIMRSRVEKLTICECDHLTHFGQLLHVRDDEIANEDVKEGGHIKALNIITLVGSFTSLLGITGIWITAMIFDTWRKKAGTKVLLQLSTAISLPLVLIIVFSLDHSIIIENELNQFVVATDKMILCVLLGALFHYAVLANFIWMLITAILQFIRYVRVLGVSRPSRFMMKLTLIGWGLPFIPVITILCLDYKNYIPNPSISRSICYPSGIYMITGVIVPVCIILIINVILFVLVIKAISKSSDMRATDKSLVCAQFRLSIFLFFLLGLTWIFGIMSFSGRLIWSYLFCLTSTIQGFVLFIYFVICDPITRNLWITVMKPQFSSSRNSVTTISSG